MNRRDMVFTIKSMSDIDILKEKNIKYINIDIKKVNSDIINYLINNGKDYLYSESINNKDGYIYVDYDTFVKGEEVIKEITSNKSKNRLLEHVDKLSGDDEMIKIYTNLSRRELEYNTIMEDKITEAVEKATKEATQNGIEQGSNQRNIEIAKNLLKANIDINVISSSTGLSKEEIEKLA